MVPEGQSGDPEAVYYKTDKGNYGVACSRCPAVLFTKGTARIEAVETAQQHLWYEHRLRRVWIEHMDKSMNAAIQLALPILMDAQTRAQERAVLGPVE